MGLCSCSLGTRHGWRSTISIAVFSRFPGTRGLSPLTGLVCSSVLVDGTGYHLVSAPSPCSWGGWYLRTGPGTGASITDMWDPGPGFLPALGGPLGSVVGIVGPASDGFSNQEGIHPRELRSSVLGCSWSGEAALRPGLRVRKDSSAPCSPRPAPRVWTAHGQVRVGRRDRGQGRSAREAGRQEGVSGARGVHLTRTSGRPGSRSGVAPPGQAHRGGEQRARRLAAPGRPRECGAAGGSCEALLREAVGGSPLLGSCRGVTWGGRAGGGGGPNGERAGRARDGSRGPSGPAAGNRGPSGPQGRAGRAGAVHGPI